MALDSKNFHPDFMVNGGLALGDSPLLDSSGNEYIKFSKTTSAVNELTATNAATGSNPTLSATGSDTNISLQLSPAGTGVVLLGDISTGTANSPTATATVTINAQRGIITTGSLTTGSASTYSFSLLNNKITATSQVFASVYNGTNSQGAPVVTGVQVATAGSATITIGNFANAATPLNGTLLVNFVVLS